MIILGLLLCDIISCPYTATCNVNHVFCFCDNCRDCEHKDCLTSSFDNEKFINTISAKNGNTSYYGYRVKSGKIIPPQMFSLILSRQGKGDDIYCEETQSRNVSGNSMIVHLKYSNSFSFIDIELESVCDKDECTGIVCDRCYFDKPVVKISVVQPVRKDDNVTIICGISPLTEDTRIVWFVSNETASNTIYNSDKYNVKTNKSMNSSLLTIYSVQHEDELNYTCQATNVKQKRKSSPMQLNVFEYPIVNVTNNALAKAGTNITMWCDVPSLSKATGISWLKNGSIIQITGNNKYGGGTLSSPSLQIFFVQMVDEGNYTCQATNPIGTGVKLSSWLFFRSSHIATHITWFKDGSIMDNKSNEKYGVGNFSSPSLEIYYVRQEDEGNYTCQASNSIGIGKSKPVFLIVMSYPVANISDIAPAKAGTNITISCIIPSSSKATHITWVKDDVIINITRNEKFGGGTLSSPSLQIYRLRLADEGNYTCQATNSIGTGRSQSVLLTVISNPPVVSISEIKPAAIGTNITLICNITSLTEEINVTWFKNNVSLNIKHTDKSHLIGGSVFFRTLIINFLEVKDGGDYTCKATNEAGDGWSEPLHLRLFENITKGTSSLHTSGPYIFSSYPSYSPETKLPMESYLSFAERTIISKSSSKIPFNHLLVPTSSVKHVEPTNSVQTSATTSIDIHPSATSLTLQANSDNRTNLNAWIITTVVICIVELIVITLVVYIVWKIREQELAMMDNLTLGTQSVILDNGTYRGTPSYIMDNGT
ncbi:TTN [Mytilus coruscus]|uniref:TTN n=1 Tax=Mytilus coruscus TaxID=42192 RepID=A0A6J8A2B8_MYTCO|nr:TTN [Mytilus coruscus]